jgi:outer membrane lipoprotein-sorting protein
MTGFICVILLLTTPLGAADKERHVLNAAEREAFLKRVKQVQTEVSTFQADFEEKRKIPSLKTPMTFGGRVYYRRDALFFMEYQRPIHYFLQVKGKEALFYVAGSPTADVVDISSMQGLAGQRDFLGWAPVRFKGQIFEDASGFHLEEKTEAASGGAAKSGVHMMLDKQSLLVKWIRIADSSGDTTEITFSGIKVNDTLPVHIRNFTLPEGTQLNRLDQP